MVCGAVFQVRFFPACLMPANLMGLEISSALILPSFQGAGIRMRGIRSDICFSFILRSLDNCIICDMILNAIELQTLYICICGSVALGTKHYQMKAGKREHVGYCFRQFAGYGKITAFFAIDLYCYGISGTPGRGGHHQNGTAGRKVGARYRRGSGCGAPMWFFSGGSQSICGAGY